MPLEYGVSPSLFSALASVGSPPTAASTARERGAAAHPGAGGRPWAKGDAGGPMRRAIMEQIMMQFREQQRQSQQLMELAATLSAGPPGLQLQTTAAAAPAASALPRALSLPPGRWPEARGGEGRAEWGSVMAACTDGLAKLGIQLENRKGESQREAMRSVPRRVRSSAMKQAFRDESLTGNNCLVEDEATVLGCDAIGTKPANPRVANERPQMPPVKSTHVEAPKEKTRQKDATKNEGEQRGKDDPPATSRAEDLTQEETPEEPGPTSDVLPEDRDQSGAAIAEDACSSAAPATASVAGPAPAAGAPPPAPPAAPAGEGGAAPAPCPMRRSTGSCRPCLFAGRGCRNGDLCPFCHACQPGERGRASGPREKHFSWRCLRKATVAARARARG
ncbi:unnamed protein product [Prorocentrum cordatum]|uniref:C3H1-type domain-containing protein n=1 Tax=Prorocentrum cordatum TaxID=2364126 RepID=A0ABN9WD98_9DINO|nr:unnamed protein product [Polarella glacialis]